MFTTQEFTLMGMTLVLVIFCFALRKLYIRWESANLVALQEQRQAVQQRAYMQQLRERFGRRRARAVK